MYNTKNYTEQGGDVTHIGGKVVFDEGGELEGGLMPNQAAATGTSGTDAISAVNALLLKLKNAGLMVGDAWNASVLSCPTPAAMPTEETATNSGHATVSIEDTAITVALNCKVSDLFDADHGSTWGTHKWLGFGVRTGLDSVVGVKFTDDTGVSVTLTSDDATEATSLGLSAGDFVLYIKAEDPAYLSGGKSFTLRADGYAKTVFTIRITETTT